MTDLRQRSGGQDLHFAQRCAKLAQALSIDIRCISDPVTNLDDLKDDVICRQVLQHFATRINSPTLRCASSMFVKYWSSMWLLPFLYSHAAALPFIQWDRTAVVIDLPEEWYWNRSLQLHDVATLTPRRVTYADLEQILHDLKEVFLQIARIARVSYAMLWENAAARVVQFYHGLDQQPHSPHMQAKLTQQKDWLQRKSAAYFQLKDHPFNSLWANWQPAYECYMRAKCCLFFQLPEAQQRYCQNCPLQRQKNRVAHE